MPTVKGWELDLSPPLPPAAIGHGTHDPVISVDWSRQARDRLEAAGGACSTASRRCRTRSTRASPTS